MKTRIWQGSFAPRGVTPLLRYYVPLRLPTKPTSGYLFPLAVCPHLAQVRTTGPGLSGSAIDLSVPAVLDHPGEPGRCLDSLLRDRLQVSPSM